MAGPDRRARPSDVADLLQRQEIRAAAAEQRLVVDQSNQLVVGLLVTITRHLRGRRIDWCTFLYYTILAYRFVCELVFAAVLR